MKKVLLNFIFRYSLLKNKNYRVFSTENNKGLEQLLMAMKTDQNRKKSYSSANVSLQVIGSGADGAPASLYVFSDQTRYLFNCGEGTQRLAHEHKIKLSKLEHIFFTYSSWKNLGGFPGMCLTLQDSGVRNLKIHGPKNIGDIFSATKNFVKLKELSVEPSLEYNSFEDSVMKVEFITLKNNNYEIMTNKNYYKKMRVDEKESMCFICRLHAKPGSLRLDLCEEKGVPLGPLLGELKSGKDVTLRNGTVVYSSEVTTPEEPGPIFIVVECPTKSYIQSLVTNTKLSLHFNGNNENEIPSIIVHFSPPEVINEIEYIEWMNKFPPSTTHLIINSASTCQGLIAVHKIQHKLHIINPIIYPAILNNTKPTFINNFNDVVLATQADTLDKFILRPRKGLDKSANVLINGDHYVNELYAIEGFKKSLKRTQETVAAMKMADDISIYPVITFLGTGSSIPNKARNTSGILLNLSDDKYMILDCGEGTYGQIVRLMDNPNRSKNVSDILKNLEGIFISHLHADHHIGIISILQARRKVTTNPLFVLAPACIFTWLQMYNEKFECIDDQFIFINLDNLTEKSLDNVKTTLELTNLDIIPVIHCRNAYGISIQHKYGWKLVYSGDTEPCDSLVEKGKECDVLIHEATMEDGLEFEARKKHHSTTSEAIDIGVKMKSKYTILTHFSQRYSKIPLFNEKFTDNVGVAFDNMQVNCQQLKVLPLYNHLLKQIFEKYYEEMENKTKQHQLRKTKILQKLRSH